VLFFLNSVVARCQWNRISFAGQILQLYFIFMRKRMGNRWRVWWNAGVSCR